MIKILLLMVIVLLFVNETSCLNLEYKASYEVSYSKSKNLKSIGEE
jgi:hypothetical protein